MDSEAVDALIAEGRDAFERGDAEGSRRAIDAALAQCESAEALEGIARALYLGNVFRLDQNVAPSGALSAVALG